MSYYTVFNDDDECHKVYSIYDENGNFLTNWENGYCYFPDNIYKDEEGHILVPDQNRTLSLNNGDYYKIEQW